MSTVPQVYAAINAVQTAMSHEGISKGRKNAQQGYAFRGIDDVYAALAPHLAGHKLCILPRVTDRAVIERETKAGGNLFYTTLTVEFDFVSVADGSKHTVCTVGEAMDSGDKSSNKAMSAAYKYACFLAFAIPTEGDNDPDSTTHEVAGRVTGPQPSREPIGTPVRHEPTVARTVTRAAPPAAHEPSDWRNYPMPAFTKRPGKTLGDLSTDDLAYWVNKYEPKPWPNPNSPIKQADLDFRAALDLAHAETTSDVPYNR